MDERSGYGADGSPRGPVVRDKRRHAGVTMPGQPQPGAETAAGGGTYPAGGMPGGPHVTPGGQLRAEGLAALQEEMRMAEDAQAGNGGERAGAAAASEELAAAQAQAAGYLDDLQRLKAEFDNYRKRVAKEQAGLLERASGSLILRLLPVLDNFDLAVASAEESRDFERMLRGIEMVFGELKEVLSTEGMARIAAKGHSFDPNYHEAALEVAGDEDGEQYVAEELRSGYTFKGRVLRPSMVKVARRARR